MEPTTTFAPAPSNGNGSWDDFLNSVIRGVGQVIQSAAGQQQGAWAGTGAPLPAQAPAADGGSMIGLLLVAVLIYLVIDAA